MAHLYRLIAAVLLAFMGSSAMADGGAFPATLTQPASSCNPEAYPTMYGPPSVSTWVCGWEGRASTQCGWSIVNAANGWDGSSANGLYKGQCYQPAPVYTCPAGASMSTGPSGESLCTCTAGLRPSNGQCVALPACPEGQHEEGGACVPDACKPNETRVNGVCVPEPPCPAGQTRVNGKCVPMKCPSQGTVSDQWYEVTSTGTSATCLYNNTDNTYCTMTVTPSVIARSDGRITYMGGYGVYTGGTCGPSEPGKPTPQDPDKPEGDPDKGTKPPGPNDPKPDTKPGGQPGGPGSNPTPPGPDGKCPEGTYKSNGGCYPKDPPKQPPDADGKCPSGYIKASDKCIPLMPTPDKEPGEEKDPSSFGGQCDAISCEGDAIQCAIARDQYKRSCELFDKETAEGNLYRAEKGKTGKVTGDLEGNREVDLSSAISAVDTFLGGAGSCPSDEVITLSGGETLTISYSRICPHLSMLGNVLVVIASICAVFLVIKRGS